MIGPGQENLSPFRASEPLAKRQRVRHRLAGVAQAGLEVDDRHAGMLDEGEEDRLRPVLRVILSGGKGPDSQHVAVAPEHPGALPHMFGRGAVHDDSVLVFHGPGVAADRERHRSPSELRHRDLHRDAGPERGVEEDEADVPSRERVARSSLAELLGSGEEGLEALLREPLRRQEMPQRTLRMASRNRSISCAVRTRGGRRRSTAG